MPLVIDAARSSSRGSTPEYGSTSTHAHRHERMVDLEGSDRSVSGMSVNPSYCRAGPGACHGRGSEEHVARRCPSALLMGCGRRMRRIELAAGLTRKEG